MVKSEVKFLLKSGCLIFLCSFKSFNIFELYSGTQLNYLGTFDSFGSCFEAALGRTHTRPGSGPGWPPFLESSLGARSVLRAS